MKTVVRWEIFELEYSGKLEGNPFLDYHIYAEFEGEHETKKVEGFYDGAGIYRVRFMPSFEGRYKYHVYGTFSKESYEGEIQVTAPVNTNNHGPVGVVEKRYLEYADGSPYYSVGTTCYAWIHQPEEIQKETLETLQQSCFNKIRFCLFPKYYQYNLKEPVMYPYKRGIKRGQDPKRLEKHLDMKFHTDAKIEDITDFDFYDFNEEFFQHVDRQISRLCGLGIEADIILMHPYDKWGFANMTRECDLVYIRYVVARYGAYRNVWWSLANEYDLMTKTEQDWEEIAAAIKECDCYGRLTSIHNCMKFYDYSRDWITHCSMQRIDLYRHVESTEEYLELYNKPVVWDEIAYEGNIEMGWGNIAGEELVRRFWEASLRGGYAGHGETYVHEKDILWWSHGGILHGNSEPRIDFLKKILEETPGKYLKNSIGISDEVVAIPYTTATKDFNPWIGPKQYYDYEIHYYGFGRPSYRDFDLPEDSQYKIEVIDTWNMTVTDMGIHSGYTRVLLPAKQYMAVRLIKQQSSLI